VNPLLDQFLAEARDLLAQAGEAVLDLERGVDPERVHQAFRAVHTIKGGSGLFDIEPVTVLVHTAEDLLDGIRDGRTRFDGELADALLSAFDQVGRWLDALEASEALPPDAEASATALVDRLAMLRPGAAPSVPSAPDGPNAPPDVDGSWFERWPEATRRSIAEAARDAPGASLVLVAYRPDPDCFYTGIDPLLLVSAGPGLLGISAELPPDVPALDAVDPLRCYTVLHAVYLADPEEVRDNFTFVEDEVEIRVGATPDAPAGPTPTSLVEAARTLVAEQIESLSVDGDPGVLEARLRSSARIADAVARRLHLDERADAALDVATEEADATPLLGHLDEIAARIEARSDESPGLPQEVTAPGSEPRALASSPPTADRRLQRHLKVEVERVDALMDLAGELVVAKNALPYLARRATDTYASPRLAKELMEHYAVFSRICEELQSAVTSVRMMAVGNAFGRFPRLVRDLARKQSKEVDLVLDGEGTEADKAIVEDLAEPLVHLVRNAIDHGIEPPDERAAAGKSRQAVLRLSARPAADRVEIEVRDDGRGIEPARVRAKALARRLHTAEELDAMSDAQAIQLVFAPGFSTAERISEISGRGVGLDAVRSAVDAMGGSVRLDSTPGLGTSVILTLPLSTAVSRIMMVEVAEHTFGLPMSVICETLRVPTTAIRRIKDRECVVVRDNLRPLYRLRELLALDPGSPRSEEHIVVMEVDGEEAAVVVDRLVEGMDVVMKPLTGVMAGVGPYRGTTLLGDGRVLLILDMEEVIRCP